MNRTIMDSKHILGELKRNKFVFQNLLENLSPKLYLWKPQPDVWCILEIICHLYDEEREDFGTRVKHVLMNPEIPLPSIDPTGWVITRNYIEQDFGVVRTKFLEERENSIQWLEKLVDPAWDNVYRHPKLGNLTAKMFLVNWLAHDYLHIRQILKMKHGFLKESTNEDLSYAGTW